MNGTDWTRPSHSDEDVSDRPSTEGYESPPGDGDSADHRAASDHPRLSDLTAAASSRIRRFVADSTVKGGASPADVADLYTAAEIVGDDQATAYLDGRYVHGELPSDWRDLQDDLTAAYREAPRGLSGEALLARLERGQSPVQAPRSIFDDPDDLEDEPEDAGARMHERDPWLSDLTAEGRRSIERHVVAEVLGYGTPPVRMMQLRDTLGAAGDERALQYLDLPFERGDRPADWEDLRDRALRLRARMERCGWDSTELFSRAEVAHPELDARELLALLEERVERGG